DGSFQTMRRLFGQHFARRPGRVFQVIRHVVKELLNAVGILHPAQLAQLFWGETEVVGLHFCSGNDRWDRKMELNSSGVSIETSGASSSKVCGANPEVTAIVQSPALRPVRMST